MADISRQKVAQSPRPAASTSEIPPFREVPTLEEALLQEFYCEHCPLEIPLQRVVNAVTRHKYPRFCSEECQERAKRRRQLDRSKKKPADVAAPARATKTAAETRVKAKLKPSRPTV